MNLNLHEWKSFTFGRIVKEPYKSKSLDVADVNPVKKSSTSIRYITRTGFDNGCNFLVDKTQIQNDYIESGNAIIVGDTTATCFYQPEEFITGEHIVVIRADRMNEYTSLFVLSVLNQEKYRYSYGRAFTKDKIVNTKLSLPILKNSDGTPYIDDNKIYSDEGYVPDWEFMEIFIKSIHYKKLNTKNVPNFTKFNVDDWKFYRVGSLFPKKKIKHYSSMPVEEGQYEFISSSSENNGVSGMVDGDPIPGNCITVSTNGECFDCFYHKNEIIISNDVEVLYSPHLNQYNAIFICSVLKLEKPKYSYGRKAKKDRVYNTIIKLPVDNDGNPDREFMENYIKNLPYGDRI